MRQIVDLPVHMRKPSERIRHDIDCNGPHRVDAFPRVCNVLSDPAEAGHRRRRADDGGNNGVDCRHAAFGRHLREADLISNSV